MGFMDNFTSDTPVEVKQPDYFRLMKEAAKAELMENAARAGVPTEYILAMATGEPVKMPVATLEELEPLDCDNWAQATAAIKDILNEWHTDNEVEEMKEALTELIETLAAAHRRELWIYSQRNKTTSGSIVDDMGNSTEIWSCEACTHYDWRNDPTAEVPPVCQGCIDGSNFVRNESEDQE